MTSLVLGDRDVRQLQCRACGRGYTHVRGFVWRDGDPWAVYFAACHGHPEHEAWIDVILGTWGDDLYADHVTFSCRLSGEGAAAVDATVASEGAAPMFGRKLVRQDALANERIADFWEVVDAISLQDEDVHGHVEPLAE